MRRSATALALLMMLPALAAAQGQATTLPPIGLPLPQISQPLPLIGMEAWQIGEPAPPVDSGRDRRGRRHGRRGLQPHSGFVYFVSPYGWDAPLTQAEATPTGVSSPVVTRPERATGRLRLDLSPADAVQVFVDGEYVGTPGDFGNELQLPAGTRRLEIRAPDHASDTVDVRISAGETISYRASLKPLPVAAAQMNAPVGNRTFYLIPGCYIGNVPPGDVKLPPGCDVSRVIVHTPQ